MRSASTRASSGSWRLHRISTPTGGTVIAAVARGGGGDSNMCATTPSGEFGGGAMSSHQEVKLSMLVARTTTGSKRVLVYDINLVYGCSREWKSMETQGTRMF
jgi:hypothetical protein